MEHRIGRLLLLVVLAAFVCLTAGVGSSLAGAAAAPALLNAGIVLLMATPVLRVLFSVLEFARAREWVFASAAATVLAILLASAFYSRSA
jgi:uncharacterized membrane protein